MAGEGGNRPYWPTRKGVNLVNGNLHMVLGSGSCVTCGGASAAAYPNPRNKAVTGPVLIFNSLGTPDTDLGAKWMLPFHTTVSLSGSTLTLIDADGTERVFTSGTGPETNQYTAVKEVDVIVGDGTDYTMTRCSGDKWVYGQASGVNQNKLKSIQSRTGDTITITRNATTGLIETITDSEGRETKLYYVTYGSSITRLQEYREVAPGDVGYQSTFFDYDSSGRLIAITNPMGETTRFTYNGSGQLTEAIDGHGEITTYAYTSGKVTSVTDPATSVWTIDYKSSTLTEFVDSRTKSWEYTFDASGRIIKVKDPLLNEEEFTWDSTTWEPATILGAKIPVTGTPWTRHKIVLTYDTAAGRTHDLIKAEVKKLTNTGTETLLKSEEWTYNAFHDILTYKNPLAKTWTFVYILSGGNSLGIIDTVTNPLSQQVLDNAYDSANNYRLTASTNGVSKTTSFAYDQNTADSYGIPDKITAPSTSVTNLKVDIRGRTYEETGPSGNTEKFEYDALDRLIRQIHPDGTMTVNVYDCCHLVAVVDENGHGETYEYDKLGRRVKVTDANGEETTMAYNSEGWLTSETDPRGKVKTYTHDDLGRETQRDYPGGWQEILTYWEPGMVKSLKTKKSTTETTVSYEYDDLYYPKKHDFPSGTDLEFEFDAAGRRTKMKNGICEKRYSYDDADRMTKILAGPPGFVENTDHWYKVEYAWNAASQCTEKKVTLRTQLAVTTGFTFTDNGMFDVVTDNDGAQTKHEYLTDDRLKKITLKNDTTTKKSMREFFYQDTNDSHAYVSAKNKHLRKTLDKKQGGTVICSASYELDKAGIRLSMTDKDNGYYKWDYDPMYQLKAEHKWAGKTSSTRNWYLDWAYDPSGNRLKQWRDGVLTDYIYGNNNEMTDAGAVDLTYDHYGNVATWLESSVTTTLSYDFERHMTSITNGTSADTHEYDGDGRRVKTKLNNSSTWRYFVHDELTDEILVEFEIPANPSYKAIYTWGMGLISGSINSVKRWYHFDGLGSTLALTDFDEVIQDTYQWSAFGKLEASTGSSVNPFRYVGQWGYYDDGARGSVHGLLLLGIRYYSPKFGRFLVWDPVPSPNLYGFVGNNCTNMIDPAGTTPRGSSLCRAMGCKGNDTVTSGSGWQTRSCCCTQGSAERCCLKIYACGDAIRDWQWRIEDSATILRELDSDTSGAFGILGKVLSWLPLVGCYTNGPLKWAAAWEKLAKRMGDCKKGNCTCIVFCYNNGSGSPNATYKCCDSYPGGTQ